MMTLPSGIGVYRSRFKDKFGSTICYGGPHRVFTEALKSMGSNVNLHMTLFLNSYNSSLSAPLSLFTQEEIEREYEANIEKCVTIETEELCRKSSDNAKEGMRKVFSGLEEKAFISKLTNMLPNQQKIISSAAFRHYFPWHVAYEPG